LHDLLVDAYKIINKMIGAVMILIVW